MIHLFRLPECALLIKIIFYSSSRRKWNQQLLEQLLGQRTNHRYAIKSLHNSFFQAAFASLDAFALQVWTSLQVSLGAFASKFGRLCKSLDAYALRVWIWYISFWESLALSDFISIPHSTWRYFVWKNNQPTTNTLNDSYSAYHHHDRVA